jgi:uncharacterized protein (DUF1810 family)
MPFSDGVQTYLFFPKLWLLGNGNGVVTFADHNCGEMAFFVLAYVVKAPKRGDDPYDLDRFVQAQENDFEGALAEVRRGRKESHWMWYIFPQFAGLGMSAMSQRYAIKSAAEARAYLAHPLLGSRLLVSTEALLDLKGRSADEIFGFPDNRKLRSCLTLFAAVSPPGSVFERVLAKYFQGENDPATLRLLG